MTEKLWLGQKSGENSKYELNPTYCIIATQSRKPDSGGFVRAVMIPIRTMAVNVLVGTLKCRRQWVLTNPEPWHTRKPMCRCANVAQDRVEAANTPVGGWYSRQRDRTTIHRMMRLCVSGESNLDEI